jgi:hypothetical protein
MKRFLYVITLIFMAPQVHAHSDQHDVDPSDTDAQSEQHDVNPSDTDVQTEQHDVNQADEAEEFKPADAD